MVITNSRAAKRISQKETITEQKSSIPKNDADKDPLLSRNKLPATPLLHVNMSWLALQSFKISPILLATKQTPPRHESTRLRHR
jgi:hypothetical protein